MSFYMLQNNNKLQNDRNKKVQRTPTRYAALSQNSSATYS